MILIYACRLQKELLYAPLGRLWRPRFNSLPITIHVCVKENNKKCNKKDFSANENKYAYIHIRCPKNDFSVFRN